MKVKVDMDTCCGHGRCYALCPEIFGEDEEGYPVVSNPSVPEHLEAQVRRASDNCPEAAIELVSGPE